jgi:hypothetical protein
LAQVFDLVVRKVVAELTKGKQHRLIKITNSAKQFFLFYNTAWILNTASIDDIQLWVAVL